MKGNRDIQKNTETTIYFVAPVSIILVSIPNIIIYLSDKSTIIQMIQNLAFGLGSFNIRFNSINLDRIEAPLDDKQ